MTVQIQKGARVKFTRPSDPQTTLTGTVEAVDGDEVLVSTEPDGVAMFTHANLATVLEDVPAPDAPPAPAPAPDAPPALDPASAPAAADGPPAADAK